MTATSEKDLVAIGMLAARLQRSVRVIEAACLELNIAPAMRINFVPHFDGKQVELLTARLANAGRELPLMLDARGCVPELQRP
jgi:hypothetical protein